MKQYIPLLLLIVYLLLGRKVIDLILKNLVREENRDTAHTLLWIVISILGVFIIILGQLIVFWV